MSLIPERFIIGGMNFSSCQLHRRPWLIRANDVVVSNVGGEAVIGMICFYEKPWPSHSSLICLQFPLLRPGEKEFAYESCAPLPTSSGSVKGSFTFVPRRLFI
ncbi:hypothetical protein Pint_25838 [Pistacia integerrima]|uniref:Uncharacterized protein n=1 Tax=Pistacia integerrima TaxID=434235 RepID=A0ACC0YA79_9ROSI|nr:hypothetical protein Pint_25838 [Pistacia integerrima]